MGQKQKILLTLIIIIIAIIAWQFYSKFFTNIPLLSSLAPKTNSNLTVPSLSLEKPAPSSVPPAPIAQNANTATLTSLMPSLRHSQPTEGLAAPEFNVNEQEIYAKLNNKYLLLKMQRQLAQEQADLLAARLKIVELNQQLNKSVTGQVYCSGYQLIDIDCQTNKAILLNKTGQLLEVSEGTILKDQTKVLKVDPDSVLMQQGTTTYRLNFYNAILVKPAPSEAPVSSGTAAPSPSSQGDNVSTTTQQSVPANKPPIVKKTLQQTKTNPIKTKIATVKTNNSPLVKKPVVSTSAVVVPPVVSTNNTTDVKEPIPPVSQNVAVSSNDNPPPLITMPRQPLALSSEPKNNEQNKSTIKVLNKDELHLLTLPQTYYTLQIYGSYKLADLSQLAKRNKIEKNIYVFHTYYLGRDWYVLVYGIYKTEKEATVAITSLPHRIKNLKPWVRTLGSVQDAIKSLS